MFEKLNQKKDLEHKTNKKDQIKKINFEKIQEFFNPHAENMKTLPIIQNYVYSKSNKVNVKVLR